MNRNINDLKNYFYGLNFIRLMIFLESAHLLPATGWQLWLIVIGIIAILAATIGSVKKQNL